MMTPLSRKKMYRYFTTPPVKVFYYFRLGSMIFFIGLVTIYSAYQLLEPSLLQELMTLVGLLLIGGGFLFSILAQVRMLIGRFLLFFKKDDSI